MTDLQQALAAIEAKKRDALAQEFRGKLSNKFVDEVRDSDLFKCDWGELISAAPTALSLMGACWIAASSPGAEVNMQDVVPKGGFKYLTNVAAPTLRSMLVNVCNQGGRVAFTTAGANMAAIQITSQRIFTDRITNVHKGLASCTKSPEALEDFQDLLQYFYEDAKKCAELATETRIAFNTWGRMVGELHACSELKHGQAGLKLDALKVEESIANVEKTFAEQSLADSAKNVEVMTKRVEKAEKRLDDMLAKVPGPWETVAQSAVTGFMQALPAITGALLPMAIATANPAVGMANILGRAANQAPPGGQSTAGGQPAAGGQGAAPTYAPQQAIKDPAYEVAIALNPLLTTFYEFLGGATRTIDWTKFEEPRRTGPDGKPTGGGAPSEEQGVGWLIGVLEGQRKRIDNTGTVPYQTIHTVIDKALGVAQAIREYLTKQKNYSSEKVDEATLASWKKDVKEAVDANLQLVSGSSNFSGSSSMPNPFAQLKIDVPKVDLSAQNAQLSSAMQGVQISQAASDVAQAGYDAAIERQAKSLAAMAEVSKKLKRLQEDGQTLENIKAVLRDCIAILVDLTIQIGKLEQFFTTLTTIIDSSIMPRAKEFNTEMLKVGKRTLANGAITYTDIQLNTIYATTLQLKGYFSLLADIARMYSEIHNSYIIRGVDLCSKLAKVASSNDEVMAVQEELAEYSHSAGTAVAKIVKEKQSQALANLKERAKKKDEDLKALEAMFAQRQLDYDKKAEDSIGKGADHAKEDSKKQLEAATGATTYVQVNIVNNRVSDASEI